MSEVAASPARDAAVLLLEGRSPGYSLLVFAHGGGILWVVSLTCNGPLPELLYLTSLSRACCSR